MAHLNLAVLAYWVVSTTKYILKVRRSTTPEAKLAEIQDALGITRIRPVQ